MRVLSIHAGADTGGIGWGLSRAFANHPTIHLRSARRSKNYIDYPHDLDWSQAATEWARADVVHLHNTIRTAGIMGGGKPFVLHHHGTYYRENTDALNATVDDAGARAVVSTLDMLDLGPDLTWIPAPHQLPRYAAMRNHTTGERLRIGHAPTNRAIKSTDAFLAVCKKLDVEPVLIEGKSWNECLQLKATCDVLFDQVSLGYGGNAIEAWGMGIPVIAGGADATLKLMRKTFGKLPFHLATEETIGDAIEALMDEATRAKFAKIGQAHAKRWHDGTETVERLTAIYSELA